MAVKKGTGKNGNAKRPAGGMQAPYTTKGAKSKARAKTFKPSKALRSLIKETYGLATEKELSAFLSRGATKTKTSTRPAGGMQAPYTKRGAKSKSKAKAKSAKPLAKVGNRAWGKFGDKLRKGIADSASKKKKK